LLQALITAANLLVCLTGVLISRSIFVIYWFVALFVTAPIILDYASATIDRGTIGFANGYALLFNALFLLTQLATGADRHSRRVFASVRVWPALAPTCVALGLLGLLALVLSVPSVSALFGEGWDAIAESRAGMQIVFINVAQTCAILATAIFVPALLTRRHLRTAFSVLAMALAVALITRSKAYALVITVPFLVHFSVSRSRLLSLTYARQLLTVAMAFAVLYLGVSFARWLGPLTELVRGQSRARVLGAVLAQPFESDLRPTYYAIIQDFERGPTLNGASYTRLLLVPLAKVYGVDLPENPIYLYYGLTATETKGVMRGSNHPTIYGDAYANFREFGLFVAIFLALALGALWQWALRRPRFVLWAVISLSSFGIPLLVRGSVFYGLYAIVLGLLMAVTVDAFVDLLRARVPTRASPP
jgi:hypothetical protein